MCQNTNIISKTYTLFQSLHDFKSNQFQLFLGKKNTVSFVSSLPLCLFVTEKKPTDSWTIKRSLCEQNSRIFGLGCQKHFEFRFSLFVLKNVFFFLFVFFFFLLLFYSNFFELFLTCYLLLVTCYLWLIGTTDVNHWIIYKRYLNKGFVS